MKSYIVVIGDIEHSKKLKGDVRGKTQKTLESVFKEINHKSGDILSPYTITQGDEFQAMYHSPDELFKHIWWIMAAIHPVRIRVSIGVGKIATAINRESTLSMDGPVFHKARKGIERMKKEKLLLSISTADDRFDRLINSTFHLLGSSLRSWKKNRYSILYKRYEGKDVKQIAGELDLSEVAVYKNIHAGTLEAIKEFTDAISETLSEMLTV